MALFIFGWSLGLAAALVSHQVFVRPRIKSAVSELRSIRSAIEPVSVSERLPGPEDCDAEGRCWYWDPEESNERWDFMPKVDRRTTTWTHWLPHHALPVPQQEAE